VIHLDGDPIRSSGTRPARTAELPPVRRLGPAVRLRCDGHPRKGWSPASSFGPGSNAAARLAPRELTGRHESLEDLWGAAARYLRERLMNAPSPAAIFSLLEAEFTARLKRPLLLNPAVAHALQALTTNPAVARIGRVQSATGFSPKRFIDLFSASVGLTPKLWSRIQRFQLVLRDVSRAIRWNGPG
jgi:hypothetical protein